MSFEATRKTLQHRREAVAESERTVRNLKARISDLRVRRNALERGVEAHRLPAVSAKDKAAVDVESVESVEARIEELDATYRGEIEVLVEERDEVETISTEVLERIQEGPLSVLDDVPIALFPVRLETRYDAAENDLLVRVYPDQIHLDGHEPELTVAEIEAAKEFWRTVWLSGKGETLDTSTLVDVVGERGWAYDGPDLLRMAVDEHSNALRAAIAERDDDMPERGTLNTAFDVDTIDDRWIATVTDDTDDEPSEVEVRHATRCREAWRRLAEEYGPERAGWILRVFRPIEASTLLSTPFEERREVDFKLPDLDEVPRREGSWTRPNRAALLPDYWTVSVYVDDLTEPAVDASGAKILENLTMGPTPGDEGSIIPTMADEATDENMRWAVDFDAAVEVGMGIRVTLDDVIDPDAPPEGRVIDRLVVTGIKATMDADASATAVRSLFDAHQYTDGLEFLPQGTPTNNTEAESAGAGDATARVETMAALACGEPVCVDSGVLHREDADTDGELFAKALSITPSVLSDGEDHVFGRVVGADASEQRDSRRMNTLFWEGTWGSYARHLLPPDRDAVGDIEAQLLSNAGLGEAVYGIEPLLEDQAVMRRLLGRLQGYQHHFVDYVRARGPFPALRVGNQPYGVLPVTPRGADIAFNDDALIERQTWRQSVSAPRLDYDGVTEAIQRRVDALTGTWRNAARASSHLGHDDATVADLYDVLSLESTGFGVMAADLIEDHTLGQMIFELLRLREYKTETPWDDGFGTGPGGLPWGGGYTDPAPELIDLLDPLFGGRTTPADFQDVETLLTGSLREVTESGVLDRVNNLRTDGGLWATDVTEQPRIAGLEWFPKVALFFGVGSAYLPLTPTRHDPPKTTPDGRLRPPTTLLVADDFRTYLKAFQRRPTLSESWGTVDEDDLLYPLLRYSVLHAYLAAVVRQGYLSDGDYQYSTPTASEFVAAAANHYPTPRDPDLMEVLDALAYFEEGNHDPETVGRLLTETLDLASHRHDAWQTSLATRRLDELRARRGTGRGSGLHVGGYGWVENLRLDGNPSTLGYVDGPSLDHATTAAILRNGYLEYHDRVGEDAPENFEEMAELLSISLTSRRVRLGLQLLQGVRNGQTPADLLGYRFERALHDHGPDLALDQFVADFRRAYPPDDWEVSGDAPDAVPSVVNGRTLAEAWHRGGTSIFSAEGLELLRSPGEKHEAVTAALDSLFDALDAVRDLLLAEAVHQLAKGDTTRAAAALDALRGDGVPPDLDVVRTPRTAQSVTHRVLLLFDPAEQPETGWPSGRDGDALDQPNVRAYAEPTLERWTGTLLGNPTKTVCLVEYAASADGAAEVFDTDRVTLADLGLSALDTLALVGADSVAASDFEAYVRYHLGPTNPDGVPDDATIRIKTTRLDDLDSTERSISETLEFARSIRALIANGRPATARDLSLPDEGAATNVVAPIGRLGVRARALHRDLSDIEKSLSTLYSCLTGEPVLDTPKTDMLGIAQLATLADAATSTLNDGVRKTVATVADLDPAVLETEVGELLGVLGDLEAEHTERPPTVTAVSLLLTGRSFPTLDELLALPAVDHDRLATTLDAIENVHEGRDVTSLETLLAADTTPLRAETYASLDAQHLRTLQATLGALAPDLPKLSDGARAVVEMLGDLESTAAFVSLGTDPDENVWETLSLEDVRAELMAVQTALADGSAITGAQTVTGTYADLFGSLDALVTENVLDSLRGAIQLDLRTILLRVSYYGVEGAVPEPAADTAPTATDDALVVQVAGVRDTVHNRVVAAALGDSPTVATYVESIEAMLGEGFVLLPPFKAPNPEEVTATLADDHRETLTGGDDLAVETWFHRMARVREGVDRLRQTFTYVEALSDDDARTLRVGQLPYAEDDRWVALPVEDDADHDLNGRLSLVVGTNVTSSDDNTLSGLFVDEWTESIPEPTTTAGISFQYDSPGSRAPQSILLAVPPTDEGWDETALMDTVVGAFELAQRRTVDFNESVVDDDRPSVTGLDRLFPAIGALGLAGPDDPPITMDLEHLQEESHE